MADQALSPARFRPRTTLNQCGPAVASWDMPAFRGSLKGSHFVMQYECLHGLHEKNSAATHSIRHKHSVKVSVNDAHILMYVSMHYLVYLLPYLIVGFLNFDGQITPLATLALIAKINDLLLAYRIS